MKSLSLILSSTGGVAAVLALSLQAAPSDDPLPPANPEITAAEIEHHVRFLASDELRGRRAGTADAERAARYLAQALKRAGVKPAGDDGGYLQRYRLVGGEHLADPELEVWTTEGEPILAEYGVDFTLRVRGEALDTKRLPITLVRSLDEMPDEVDRGAALVLDGKRAERREWLREREMGDGSGWGLYVELGSSKAGTSARLPRSRLRPASAGDDPADVVVLRGPLRDALQAGELESLQLHYEVERKEAFDQNVVGILPGVGTKENPELAKEAIVISAHYDHVGVDTRAEERGDEDTIRNGADDDASGVASVLELAEAFAAGDAPARTLVFLLAGGEEQGLWGTRYYIDHPAIPLERTVTNLNFEMLGRPDDLVGGSGKVWLTGFERTTLGPAFRERGLDVVADQRLDQNFFRRSDNYAFVQRGIVGQTLSTYNMHEDYHRVTDEADTLDYAHMEACVRAGLAAAKMLADGSLTPEWLPGGNPTEDGER